MNINKASREDIPQIIDLYADLFNEEIDMQVVENNYNTIMENADYQLLVVKEEQEVLGTCIVIVCTSLAESFLVVEDVVVKNGIRGRGIGKMLFEAIDRTALERKCNYAILVSSGFRKGAHTFYEKMGYVDDVRGFRKVY